MVLGIAMGAGLAILGLVLLIVYANTAGEVSACVLLMFIGFAFASCFAFMYTIMARKFEVDAQGITIYYLSRYQVHYSWEDVTEISICDVHHTTKGPLRFDLVIRILVGTENKKRKSLASLLGRYETWRQGIYSMIHFRRVLLIRYSTSRLEEIRNASGKEILDYRTEDAKRGEGKPL